MIQETKEEKVRQRHKTFLCGVEDGYKRKSYVALGKSCATYPHLSLTFCVDLLS